MARRAGFNPFYVLLVIAGVAFAVTACAYGVMTFVELRTGVSPAAGSAFIKFMETQGATTMAAELAVLAVATVGAIGTDRMWQRRAERHQHRLTGRPEEARPGNAQQGNAQRGNAQRGDGDRAD